MRLLLISLLAVHGLIHLLGFAKAFGYAEISQLKQPVSAAAGVAWLAGCLAFLAAAILYLAGASSWWPLAAGLAIALSQILIFTAWGDAKFGTVANLLILLPATAAALDARPTSFRHRYGAVVREALARPQQAPVLVTEDDLQPLPALVQRYLRVAGVVGRPRFTSVQIAFTGEFHQGPQSRATAFRSEQVNTLSPAVRAFLRRMPMYGVPTEGLHLLRNGHATMQIKLASAVQVVNARGPEMDRSETVTFFNDLCLFAPAALIDRERIAWADDGPGSVRAAFTLNGITIHARLFFNGAGELTDFVSPDRYYSADGKTYRSYPWSTPVLRYQTLGGRRVPLDAEAVWHMPEGKFTYGHFHAERVEYGAPTF
ncbi:MAG: hypothetical protein IT162_11945 [Bryobacterales bacterium]|nr:hypothetical protein [Bryobacterales bacterium]